MLIVIVNIVVKMLKIHKVQGYLELLKILALKGSLYYNNSRMCEEIRA